MAEAFPADPQSPESEPYTVAGDGEILRIPEILYILLFPYETLPSICMRSIEILELVNKQVMHFLIHPVCRGLILC
jgi:hypothetical protein